MGILALYAREFWEPVQANAAPEPGHVYWVPVREINETTRILDAVRVSPEEHHGVSFEIVDVTARHFRKRNDRLPIHRLNLKDSQEIVVEKAKLRPAILLASNVVANVETLPAGPQQKLARCLRKECFLMAPLNSVSHMLDPGTFGPVLVARIRALQYPQFMCVTDLDNSPDPASIIRLDRVFPSYLGKRCESAGKKLRDELLTLLLSQLCVVMGIHDPGQLEAYRITKELVTEALPDELRVS